MHRVLYSLPEMIFLAVCCAVASYDDWVKVADHAEENLDWFRKFMPLKNGVPSHDTFSRVFSRLDPVLLSECVSRWVDSLQGSLEGQGVHLDGKTIRPTTAWCLRSLNVIQPKR